MLLPMGTITYDIIKAIGLSTLHPHTLHPHSLCPTLHLILCASYTLRPHTLQPILCALIPYALILCVSHFMPPYFAPLNFVLSVFAPSHYAPYNFRLSLCTPYFAPHILRTNKFCNKIALHYVI